MNGRAPWCPTSRVFSKDECGFCGSRKKSTHKLSVIVQDLRNLTKKTRANVYLCEDCKKRSERKVTMILSLNKDNYKDGKNDR